MDAASSNPIEATVMVLTRNSAETLDAALRSVEDFTEVIVSDGGSSDLTIDIARNHGAVVIAQDPQYLDQAGRLLDYAGARHQVVKMATKPWIFHLDADEIATPALTEEIAALPADSTSIAAYRCPARHIVDDVEIRSAANYPMSFTRVFRREAVRGYAGPINEHPEFDEEAQTADLRGEFLIPMPAFSTVLKKWLRYQRIVAGEARRDTSEPINKLGDELRVVRWLAWRTWKSRRTEPGPHMPLRYDAARVVFHLMIGTNAFINRVVARIISQPPQPSGESS